MRENREILFRGQRKDNGEWAYGCYVEIGRECFIVEYSAAMTFTAIMDGLDKDSMIEVVFATVGQFTGLKKKGKKVFAGDICSVDNQDCEQIVGVVEYFEGMGQWFVAREDGDDEPLWEYSFEIIGNRHTHPELLK